MLLDVCCAAALRTRTRGGTLSKALPSGLNTSSLQRVSRVLHILHILHSFCSGLILAHDRITHCKYWYFSATKSAKSPILDPQKNISLGPLRRSAPARLSLAHVLGIE